MAEFEDFFEEAEEEGKTVKAKERPAEYEERKKKKSGHRKKRPQRWKFTLPLSKNFYVKKLSQVNWRD